MCVYIYIYCHPSAFVVALDTKVCRCLSPSYKMEQYLHITYIYPSEYFQTSIDYL